MFFFIVGIQQRSRRVEGGVPRTRGCPACGVSRVFHEVETRPWLTLFFVPVVPVGGRHVRLACDTCKSQVAGFPGSVPLGTRGATAAAGAGKPQSWDRPGGSEGQPSRPTQIHCVRCGQRVLISNDQGRHEVTCHACGESFELVLKP